MGCHWLSPDPHVYEWVGEEGCGELVALPMSQTTGTIPTGKMEQARRQNWDPKCPGGWILGPSPVGTGMKEKSALASSPARTWDRDMGLMVPTDLEAWKWLCDLSFKQMLASGGSKGSGQSLGQGGKALLF